VARSPRHARRCAGGAGDALGKERTQEWWEGFCAQQRARALTGAGGRSSRVTVHRNAVPGILPPCSAMDYCGIAAHGRGSKSTRRTNFSTRTVRRIIWVRSWSAAKSW